MKNKKSIFSAAFSLAVAACLVGSVCHAAQSDINVRGDIDSNGTVSVSDIMCLKKYLLGVTDKINQNADMNNDNMINIIDLIILKNDLISEDQITCVTTADTSEITAGVSDSTKASETVENSQQTSDEVTTTSLYAPAETTQVTSVTAQAKTTTDVSDVTQITSQMSDEDREKALFEKINDSRSAGSYRTLIYSNDLKSAADMLIQSAAGQVSDTTPVGRIDIQLPPEMAFYPGKFECYCVDSDNPAYAADCIIKDSGSDVINSGYNLIGISYCRISQDRSLWYVAMM